MNDCRYEWINNLSDIIPISRTGGQHPSFLSMVAFQPWKTREEALGKQKVDNWAHLTKGTLPKSI